MKRIFLLTASLFIANAVAAEAEPPCCSEELEAAAAVEGSIYEFDAKWTNQHGEEVSLSDFKGKPVLLTMGYATCKFACPRLAADLMAIERELTDEQKKEINILFITIDPERDTPEVMAEFLGQYKVDQTRWHGLRSSADNVLELSVAIGTRYRRIDENDFAHSNRISLLSAAGVLLYTQEGLGTNPEKMIAAVGEAIDASKEGK